MPAPVFGSSVTAGNLLVAIGMGSYGGEGFYPTPGANGWTRIGGSGTAQFNGTVSEVWTRTALVGDGTTPPAVAGGGNFNPIASTLYMWEIANPGVVDVSEFIQGMSAAGGTTTALVTGSANELALLATGCYFASTVPAISGTGWTVDQTTGGGQNPGDCAHLAVPSSGTSVSATIAASGSQTITYSMVILGATSAGSETGTISQTLPGPTNTAAGGVFQEAGVIVQALPGPTQAGALFIPGAAGTGLRQFSTFGG